MNQTNITDRNGDIFPTVISIETRVMAQKFRAYQSQASKAKGVYLNTLTVSAVNLYLHSLGWTTNLEGSDSQNPVLQTMMDTADLEIPGYGKLECRFVMAGEKSVNIPPEVWTDRIGYVIVRLDSALERADLLGFVDRVNRSPLSLARLKSLTEFPAYLSLQKSTPVSETVVISNWFTRQLDRGWHQLEELFSPAVALNFRSPQKLADTTEKLNPQINPVKLVQFAENITIALILNIQPQTNKMNLDREQENKIRSDSVPENSADFVSSSRRSPQEFNISMTVCNSQVRQLLPPGLELVIFDAGDRPVMIAQANENKTIEFCFSGKLGENFRVELVLEEEVKIENFII